MPTYKYEAMDTSGAEVKDSIETTNEEEASQKIKAKGYFVTKLTASGKDKKGKKKGQKTGKSRKTFTIGGVSSKQLVTFTRQLSTLQDAGLPVLRSLRILERQMKPSVLKNALIDVVEDVESGAALSEALGKHPKAFSKLYVNMIKAGEAGGALEVILQRLADFLEKAASLKSKIIGAMVYPSVVIFVAVAILTFIMVSIIPKFKKIFDEFGQSLPQMTRYLGEAWDWFESFEPMLVLALAAPAAVLAVIFSPTLRWHAPGLGALYRWGVQADVLRTLGRLLAVGHTVPAAMAFLAASDDLPAVARRAARRAAVRVERGEPLDAALADSGLLPPHAAALVRSAGLVRNLPWALVELGDHLAGRAVRLVRRLSLVLSPLLVALVGVVVGFIALAMFLPLIQLLTGMTE